MAGEIRIAKWGDILPIPKRPEMLEPGAEVTLYDWLIPLFTGELLSRSADGGYFTATADPEKPGRVILYMGEIEYLDIDLTAGTVNGDKDCVGAMRRAPDEMVQKFEATFGPKRKNLTPAQRKELEQKKREWLEANTP